MSTVTLFNAHFWEQSNIQLESAFCSKMLIPSLGLCRNLVWDARENQQYQ